jgi:hypothetical protein
MVSWHGSTSRRSQVMTMVVGAPLARWALAWCGEDHREGLLPLRQSAASPGAPRRRHGHVLSFSHSHGIDGGEVARQSEGRRGYGGRQREMARAQGAQPLITGG